MSYSSENSFKAVIKPGLMRIKILLERLGSPERELKIIHIAGTNGKGSVAAFLKSILKESGYRVGAFISPHLIDETERISVDGRDIERSALDEILCEVDKAAEEVCAETGERCTIFERYTGAALTYFKRQKTDVCILETGMGGRLDTTNVIDKPLLTIITKIGIDHSEFLGDTEVKIAAEKAGIIKEGADCVVLSQKTEINKVFLSKCRELNAPIHFTEGAKIKTPSKMREVFDYKGYRDIISGLLGVYQVQNACTAIEAAEVLKNKGYKISDDALRGGLKNAVHHARFELLDNGVIFDGAHNPNGMEALKKSLERYLPNKKYGIIISVMADKDIDKMLNVFKGESVKFYPVEIPNYERSMKKKVLAEKIKAAGFACRETETIRDAVAAAKKENTHAIACGSLYLYEYIK